jgi:hypothetical protein
VSLLSYLNVEPTEIHPPDRLNIGLGYPIADDLTLLVIWELDEMLLVLVRRSGLFNIINA